MSNKDKDGWVGWYGPPRPDQKESVPRTVIEEENEKLRAQLDEIKGAVKEVIGHIESGEKLNVMWMRLKLKGMNSCPYCGVPLSGEKKCCFSCSL